MKQDSFPLEIAACFGFMAVVLGMFGAHGMKEKWGALPDKAEAAHREEIWRTASHYQLIHSVALMALALSGANHRHRWTSRCWVAGIVVFSGSLYLYSFTGIRHFGAITPFGGVLIMAGWFALVIRARKKDE